MKLSPKNLEVKHLDGSPEYKKLFRAVSGKVFGKGGRFTGVKDIDFKILEELDDSDLTNVCVVNTYLNDICKDETFWRNRLLNKYRFLLGNAENIIHNYKAKDILWKQYYIWLHGAVYGDQFFSYLYADVLRREDVVKVLEYTYPNSFSDMDQYHFIAPKFKEKLDKVKLIPSSDSLKSLYFSSILKYFATIWFQNHNVISKRILLYNLGIIAIQKDFRVLGKHGRYVYNMPVFEQKNMSAEEVIENMKLELGGTYFHPNVEEMEKFMYNSIDLRKEYFLEMEINFGRTLAEEESFRNNMRWVISLGISVTLGAAITTISQYFSKK